MPLTPEGRARLAERMRAQNADPEFAAKRDANGRRMMAQLQADPKIRARTIAASVAARRTAKARKLSSEKAKRFWADPERRERQRQEQIALGADPAVREQRRRVQRLNVMMRYGEFWCPPELKRAYVKLRNVIGYEAARETIRRQIEREALAGVDYGAEDVP